MRCPRCQVENPDGARFCEDCGGRLQITCATCGQPVGADKRFCRSCGAPLSTQPTRFAAPDSYTPRHLAERILTSGSVLEGERKQVTVLFADLKGSMELLADRDPEEARKLLDLVLEHMMEAVHRYEGTVNQVMGDGIMALFGAPLAHEDHAVRACYAALDMQGAIRRYAEEVRRAHGAKVQIRVGLNSGEVIVRAIGSDLHMDYTAVGQTTHLAARMEQLADPGSTLLTLDTLRLAEGYVEVKRLGPVPVKGLETPVDVYELVRAGARRSRKMDTIVTDGTTSAFAAKRATSTIPIVAAYVADPVGSGLVASLARPGGNVTGFSVLSPGIVQKALGMLKEIAPQISRVGVWMDPTNPGQTLLDEQMDAAAKVLALTLQRIDVRSTAQLDGAFGATLAQRAEALFVYPLPVGPSDRKSIARFAIKNRLPTVAISPHYVPDGLLVAYGVNAPDLYRRAGAYVDRILRGTKPADLPVEQPTKFELVINLKTAKALGLTIPPSLLLRADQVVE